MMDEVSGSLKIHEHKASDSSAKSEEKAVLPCALGKSKKKDEESSQGRGKSRGPRRGHGRSSHPKEDTNEEEDDDDEKKS